MFDHTLFRGAIVDDSRGFTVPVARVAIEEASGNVTFSADSSFSLDFVHSFRLDHFVVGFDAWEPALSAHGINYKACC